MKIGKPLVPLLFALALAGCSRDTTPTTSGTGSSGAGSSATTGRTVTAQDVMQTSVSATGSATFVAGASTTVTYTLQPTNGDGQNGCNVSQANPGTLTIVASPGGLVIEPSNNLVFTACKDGNTTNEKTVTFKSSTPGTYDITATMSGGNGSYNLSQTKYKIIVTSSADVTKPVITRVGPTTEPVPNSDGWYGANVEYSFRATDNVAFPVPLTNPYDFSKFTSGEGANVTVSSGTVTDAAGDVADAIDSAELKVDLSAPTNVAFSGMTDGATYALGNVPAAPTCTATDTLSGLASCNVTGYSNALGEHTLTATATDKVGHSATASLKYTVTDQTPPTVSVPENIIAEATSAAGAAVTFAATVTDNVDENLNATCQASGATITSPHTFPLGTTTISCTATDAAGNTGTNTFTVTVQDKTAPTLTLPGDLSREGDVLGGSNVSFTATASDVVDGPVTVTCTPASGSLFAVGTTKVDCEATDAHGNKATGSFNVTVTDTTKPTLHLPVPLTAEATGPNGAAVSYSASATDIVSGSVDITCTPASGSTFALGTTAVQCSATDGAGNTQTGTFNVTVRDSTAPSLGAVPADIVAEATSAAGAVVTYTNPTATDAVDPNPSVVCMPASGSTFPLGNSTVTCTATDASGNASAKTFTVKVQDTTAPDLTVPMNIIKEATSAAGAAVSYSATATDAVDAHPAVSCTPASGSVFPIGTTTVSCTATDASGNASAAKTFTVKVEDTTAPALADHADVTAEATSSAGTVVTYTSPTATDIVDANPTVVCTPASGSTFALGNTTVTCTATDASGNASSKTFTVKVQDTTAPVVNQNPNLIREATSATGTVVTYTNPAATDAVTTNLTVTCTPASGSTFPINAANTPTTTTVTCSATDAAGNTGSSTFTVTVQDTTKPSLPQNIAPITVSPNPVGSGSATVTYTTPTASDTVDANVDVTCTPASGSTFLLGTTTVSCTATDNAGNVSTTTFKVNVLYPFQGFFQPVDMNGVYNTVKVGSAVPIKFKLGGNQGLNIFATGYPNTTQVSCSTNAVLDDIEETVTAGGSSLTYDATAGQYLYVWKTSTAYKAGLCYALNVKFADGTTQTAYFKFK